MPCNPFRARNLSPGRVPYSFRPGQDIDQLIARFRDHHHRGQIVGPHGTGKTTLLFQMGTELTKAGYEVVRVPLEPSGGGVSVRRRLRDLRPPTVTDPAKRSVLLVDGIGLADWWTRRRFLRIARRQGWGILLTAHRDLGLPVLCRTALTADDARRIIPLIVGLDNQAPAPRSLSKENPATGPASAKASNGLPHLTDAFEAHGAAPSASAAEELVPQELVAQLLDRHDGNLREVLFSLYDWYDDRQREQEEKRGHRHSRF